jgi:hypothetical protein
VVINQGILVLCDVYALAGFELGEYRGTILRRWSTRIVSDVEALLVNMFSKVSAEIKNDARDRFVCVTSFVVSAAKTSEGDF